VHVAVVGGGVVGLLSAVECALAGHQVTVVEQDSLPSRIATSHDHHRILRALHVADTASTSSAVRAHYRWIELERILSSRFYDRVGALTVLPRAQLPDALSALWNSGSQAKVLDGDDLVRRLQSSTVRLAVLQDEPQAQRIAVPQWRAEDVVTVALPFSALAARPGNRLSLWILITDQAGHVLEQHPAGQPLVVVVPDASHDAAAWKV